VAGLSFGRTAESARSESAVYAESIFSADRAKASQLSLSLHLPFLSLAEVIKVSACHATRQPPTGTPPRDFPFRFLARTFSTPKQPVLN